MALSLRNFAGNGKAKQYTDNHEKWEKARKKMGYHSMNEQHKKKLTKHYKVLVNEMDVDTVLDVLISDFAIKTDFRDEVRHLSQKDKARKLLDILPRYSEAAYFSLKRAIYQQVQSQYPPEDKPSLLKRVGRGLSKKFKRNANTEIHCVSEPLIQEDQQDMLSKVQQEGAGEEAEDEEEKDETSCPDIKGPQYPLEADNEVCNIACYASKDDLYRNGMARQRPQSRGAPSFGSYSALKICSKSLENLDHMQEGVLPRRAQSYTTLADGHTDSKSLRQQKMLRSISEDNDGGINASQQDFLIKTKHSKDNGIDIDIILLRKLVSKANTDLGNEQVYLNVSCDTGINESQGLSSSQFSLGSRNPCKQSIIMDGKRLNFRVLRLSSEQE